MQKLQCLRRVRGNHNFIKRFNPTLCCNKHAATIAADAGNGAVQARVAQAIHDCVYIQPAATDDAVPESAGSEYGRGEAPRRQENWAPLRTASDKKQAVIVQEADHGRNGELQMRECAGARGSCAGRPQAFGCRGNSRHSPAWATDTCCSISLSALLQLLKPCGQRLSPVMQEQNTHQFLNAAPKP